MLQGCDAATCGAAPCDIATVKPLEVEIELHQRLARDIDRGPAVERAVAERAGEAVDHHDRAVEPHLGLGRQRRLQQAGRIDHEFGRDVLPLQRRRGAVALISNFSGCSAARALPVTVILRSAADGGVGVDALDAVLDAVAQIGEHHRAAGDADMLDRERIAGTHRRWRLRLGGRLACASRSRSSGTVQQPGARSASSVISRPAGPHARQRHVGLDAGRRSGGC